MTRRHHQSGNRDAHVVQTGYRHQSDPNATWAREPARRLTPETAAIALAILAAIGAAAWAWHALP